MTEEMSNGVLNLDANASFGLTPFVRNSLPEYLGELHNPSSVHRSGQRVRALIEESRDEIAALVGMPPEYRVIFTSGASEANAFAVHQAAWGAARGGCAGDPVFVTSAVEHHSILQQLNSMAALGIAAASVPPLADGSHDIESIIGRCTPATRLVSIMAANNESGHVYPLASMVETIKRSCPNVSVHCDAVQAVGKTEFQVRDTHADLISLSGHKLGALSGVGALIAKRSLDLKPLIVGGPQEHHLRAGTENVLGIISFGLAARELRRTLAERTTRMRRETDLLLRLLRADIPDLALTCALKSRLPNTLSIRFDGVRADDLVVALDREGIRISSGAACASGKPEPSHVLLALGLTPEQARSTVRISTDGNLSDADIERAADAMRRLVARFRNQTERA